MNKEKRIKKKGPKRIATERKIVEITRKMIEEKGYSKTTTNAIANKAEVNISLLYRYFPNGKPDILKRVVNTFFERIKVFKLEDVKIKLGQEKEYLKMFLKNLILNHRENSHIVMAMAEAYLSNKEVFKDINEAFKGDEFFFNLISKILFELGYTKKNLPKVSKMIHHIIDSLIHRQVFYDNMLGTDDELIEFLVDLILKYVKS